MAFGETGAADVAGLALLPSGAGIFRLVWARVGRGNQRALGGRLAMAALGAPDGANGRQASVTTGLPLAAFAACVGLALSCSWCPESYHSHSSLYLNLLSRKF